MEKSCKFVNWIRVGFVLAVARVRRIAGRNDMNTAMSMGVCCPGPIDACCLENQKQSWLSLESVHWILAATLWSRAQKK